MSTFIYAVVALVLLETLTNILALAAGKVPKRSLKSIAMEVVLGVALAIWGILVVSGCL